MGAEYTVWESPGGARPGGASSVWALGEEEGAGGGLQGQEHRRGAGGFRTN